MSENEPRLSIVPAPDLPPFTEGSERVVAELSELVTEQMAKAALAGFRLGVQEVTSLLAERGHLESDLADAIRELTEKWEGESE